MDEFRVLLWLIRGIFKVAFLLVRGVLQLVWRILRAVVRRLRGAPAAAPSPPPERDQLGKATSAKGSSAEREAIERLTARVSELAKRARGLEARCNAEPLCAPLLRTLREFALPKLDQLLVEARRATPATDLEPLASSAGYLEALIRLVSRMADQRCDPALDELIDDADTLSEACYRPIVDYCRINGVPLGSDRAAAVFGDDCSPWLGRIDDPTGLAILNLPWKWLAEVHRWPAIAHEVGHDFYDSVAGLDDELLRRHGLGSVAGDARVLDGSEGVSLRDVERIVTNWRRELIADAFGVMMLGPAYVVTTAAIFARLDEPRETLTVQVDGDDYEVHPPAHIRVAAVCRLLARMGYGAAGVTLEQSWRAQHGEPTGILLPIPDGWLRVPDEPFIERAVALTASLYQEGFTALRGIPLSSMPGFDFGPREHEAALAAKAAFLAYARAPITDARLLIAGAVLAWAERPADALRLLRAARLAVGKLPLRIADDAAAAPARTSSTQEVLRDAFLLDLLLAPPVALRGRGPQGARR
jgi:hypothetical protein